MAETGLLFAKPASPLFSGNMARWPLSYELWKVDGRDLATSRQDHANLPYDPWPWVFHLCWEHRVQQRSWQPLGVAGYRVDGAWVGKTIHQVRYWAIMWTNSQTVVSAEGRMLTNTMLYIWTVKSLIYKRGLCFLSYLTLLIILPDRS